MSKPRHLAICLLLTAVAATVLANRNESTVITAAGIGEKVRFSSPGETAQIRVQILSMTGETLFDSAWRDGNVLDWIPSQPMPNGSYRCVVSIKDLEGQVAQKEATVTAQGNELTIEAHTAGDGFAIIGRDESRPKITLVVHDGKNGAIVSTSGDLSFRFGDFLAGKDSERMRVTAEGNVGIGTDKPQAPLDVNGLIRTSQGIVFSDGTILRTSNGEIVIEKPGAANASPVAAGTLMESVLRSQSAAIPTRLAPRPSAGPEAQFKVDAAGVHIGTTNAFGLDVAGNVALSSNLSLPATASGGGAGVIALGGGPFAHSYGGYNTFIGLNAGNFAMSGGENTVTGVNALQGNGTGAFNTAIGNNALLFNSSGNNNIAMGFFALSNNNGSGNIGIGRDGGGALTSGNNNIDIGNTGVAGESGTVRIGTDGTHTAVFLPGTVNVAKILALPATSSASVGVITVGGNRFAHNFGTNNTFIGTNAGNTTMSGGSNTGNGASALSAITSGNNNVALGDSALKNNQAGNNNTAVGFLAGRDITGSNNIVVGSGATTIGGESNNIFIGSFGDKDGAPSSNTIRIGNTITQTAAFIAGVYQKATGANQFAVYVDDYGKLGTIASSASVKRDIAAIGDTSSALFRLRPVSFLYRDDTVGIRQYGLIAEEVAEVMPELVGFSPAGEVQTVRYHFLAPLLLNEVQKQQRRIEELEARLEQLEKLLAREK